MATDSRQSIISNTKLQDSSSKLIFGDNILSSQFFRDYADMEILKKIQPEDIEDVSERYVPLYSTERESDTVKKVNISRYLSLHGDDNKLNLPLYIISLIEHKTKVEYNVGMQILRYMIYIWEDYEKEMTKQYPGISSRRDFRYPPILPIVYYEGAEKWKASLDISERILCGELLGRYLPHFQYQLVCLHDYSNEDLLGKGDEISLAMLINKIQCQEDMSAFVNIPGEQMREILKDTPEYLLEVIAKLLRALLYKMNLPEEETETVVSRIKERKMARLFENVKMDIQAERRERAEEEKKRIEAVKKRVEAEKKRVEEEKKRVEAEKKRIEAEKKLNETEKRLEEVKSQCDTTEQKLDAALQTHEIYRLISRMLRKNASETEIKKSLMLAFPLTEEQAEEEYRKVYEE